STRRSITSPATARSTPRPSSRATSKRLKRSSPASIARSCCTTPRPNSPTAASSAWVPRSASPRGDFTRAGRWASSSSRRSNMLCTGTDRSGPEIRGRGEDRVLLLLASLFTDMRGSDPPIAGAERAQAEAEAEKKRQEGKTDKDQTHKNQDGEGTEAIKEKVQGDESDRGEGFGEKTSEGREVRQDEETGQAFQACEAGQAREASQDTKGQGGASERQAQNQGQESGEEGCYRSRPRGCQARATRIDRGPAVENPHGSGEGRAIAGRFAAHADRPPRRLV